MSRVRGSLVLLGGGLLLWSGSIGCSRAQAPAAAENSAAAVAQVGYLKAAMPGDGDQFGAAVAISGDGSTMAVGAPAENSAARAVNGDQANDDADDSGAVYVYTRSGGAWAQQAFIKAANGDSLDQFGTLVALSGDGNTLVVSAYFEDSGAKGVNANGADNSIGQAGAVYVFVRNGTAWSQQAYLKASNTGETDDGDTFGFGMAISDDGNTVAVGAPSEDSNASGLNGNQGDNSAPGAGAVYVFTRSGSAWSQQAYLKSESPVTYTAGDLFGYSIALNANGNTMAVGAYDEGSSFTGINGAFDNKAGGSGAVFVFTRSGTTWTREAFLKAKEQDRNDSLGSSLAISDDGNTIATGALDEDSMTTGINAVKAGDSGETDAADDNSAGAVYVFVRNGTAWSEQVNIKSSNTGKNDWFGVKVALSGNGQVMAVAASNEDSGAKGIDGNQGDDTAAESGAVYLFRRNGNAWTQVAYIKSSNSDEFDEFGSSVALSGDGSVLAAGAKFEDSAATGFNGNQADNALTDAGAIYVFSTGTPTGTR
jgi:hypothetical protein